MGRVEHSPVVFIGNLLAMDVDMDMGRGACRTDWRNAKLPPQVILVSPSRGACSNGMLGFV